ncbi:GFA domain-containing protein [Mycena sanguinolenta]|uniref:GFA domain-containing protein n=1 Tax=Mycena sanguinolenta TaxID=230812 RepID=A0A8H6YX81_9AGAR|nr:GFA domain-containing protein [Mycena sanguinolenta]
MPHQGKCLCGQTAITLNSTHTERVRNFRSTANIPWLRRGYVKFNRLCATAWIASKRAGVRSARPSLLLKRTSSSKGPLRNTLSRWHRGTQVLTRVFCSNCGSAISHLTVAFGDAQAIQTGNFADFEQVPVTTEYFVKDRWTGLQYLSFLG